MDKPVNPSPIVIAVCGKGGVGKTSVSAVMARILAADPKSRVLAIDADPAVGLAGSLGFRAHRTVDEIRNTLIQRVEQGQGGNRQEILALLDYEVLDALEEQGNLAFLAIGRPETDGCYCQVNTFLKEIIRSLAGNFHRVIIDGEAGIEQVHRRVMEKVTHVVLVSDGSVKGLNVARSLKDVCDQRVSYEKIGLILNRVRPGDDPAAMPLPAGLPLLGCVPEDDAIRSFDMQGRSLLDLPPCPALSALTSVLRGPFLSGGPAA